MEIWEPEDLNISTKSATDAEESKEMVFRKSYTACVTVYVPTLDHSYPVIHCECFSQFIEDDVGELYEGYIAEFFAEYTEITKISVRR